MADMSDYEEEHFPVGMRMSFSSSFDAEWRKSASFSEQATMKRSRSEFCHGECMRLDSGCAFGDDSNQNVGICDAVSDASPQQCFTQGLSNGNNTPYHSPKYSLPVETRDACLQSFKECVSSKDNNAWSSPLSELPSGDDAAVIECSSQPSTSVGSFYVIREDSRLTGDRSGKADASDTEMHENHSYSEHCREQLENVAQQRSVADIRNNIPSVGNVRRCDDSSENTRQCSLPTNYCHELTQLKKRSPGVAKRLEATTPSRSDPTDFSLSDFTMPLDEVSNVDSHASINSSTVADSCEVCETETLTPDDSTPVYSKPPVDMPLTEKSVDADYFSFGDRYMSVDETRMWIWDSSSEDTNGTVDPFCYSGMLPDAAVLDSHDDDDTAADQTFRMSPDLTECDSDDVLEDEDAGGDHSCGMPVVEDGLSGSDTEEIIAARRALTSHDPVSGSRETSETLTFGSQQPFPISESEVEEFFSGTASNPASADSDKDDDIVEKAIRDIRLAIEQSKGCRMQAKYDNRPPANMNCAAQDDESVWVVRSGDASVLPVRQEHVRVTENEERKRQMASAGHNTESISVLEKIIGNQRSSPGLPPVDCQSDIPGDSLFRKCATRLGFSGLDYTTLPCDCDDDELYMRKWKDSFGMTASSESGRKCSSVEQRTPACSDGVDTYAENYCPSDETFREKVHDRQFRGSRKRALKSVCEHHCEVCMHSLDDDETAQHLSMSSSSEQEFNAEDGGDYNTDEETDELLERQYNVNEKGHVQNDMDIDQTLSEEMPTQIKKSQPREALLPDADNRTVLIEGVLFRTRYLGSTKIMSECNPSKARRMLQAQEAVGRIKLPDEDSQPSTEVDLFVSAEKIMVLDIGHREVIMDHALQTISYIADIGDLLVIMVRLAVKVLASPSSVANGNTTLCDDDNDRRRRRVTICCHVFESDEAQLIAQSIGQAFQVAYAEFLKANGIEDPSLLKDVDYQEVLNQQQIFGEELALFSNNEKQKEVTITKMKGEPLGIVLVESGWGSMLPTVVIANLMPSGPAARTGRLNIGDQIMSIDGTSLVGLPLAVSQTYVKAARQQTVVRLKLVSCAPVVEVLIKRPHVKYQLGFSVQNGVICSLLRGGIGERGGVRVGHRIIEINGHSMVAVPHERIVHLLATSVGEIHMKTMQTSVFRLLTGQDVPHYI